MKLSAKQQTLKFLKVERDEIQRQLEGLNTAIAALGGGGVATAPVKRKAGGWPKGKPRGPRKPIETNTDTVEVEAKPIAKLRRVKATNKNVAGTGASLGEAANA